MRGTEYLGLKYLIFILVLFSLPVLSQQYPDQKVHRLLTSGIDNLINQQYEKAEKDFLNLKIDHPELPLGDTYLAATEIIKSYDLGTEFNEEYINSCLEKASITAEKLLEKDNNSLWHIYFQGLIKGYNAYYEAIRERWIRAVQSGISALQIFEGCIGDSIVFYDAYTAIGTYFYWKSRTLESLQWLPFVDDQTSTGIGYLEFSADNFSYNQYLAVNSLIWIYIDLKEYQKAANTARKMLLIYPESRFFKWALARALEEIDRSESIEIYSQILESYGRSSPVNEIIIKHKIAQQYYLQGRKEFTRKLCLEILSKRGAGDYNQHQLKKRFERVEMLLGELDK